MAVPADLNSVISSADAAALHRAPAEVEQVALDLGEVELALVARLQQVARLGQRAGARVDIDAGAAHRVARRFRASRREGSSKIDMRAGPQ